MVLGADPGRTNPIAVEAFRRAARVSEGSRQSSTGHFDQIADEIEQIGVPLPSSGGRILQQAPTKQVFLDDRRVAPRQVLEIGAMWRPQVGR